MAEERAENLAADSLLGNYKIAELLGVGGMGEVYLAEDTRLKRKVALKVLRETFAKDKERLYRFKQEALAASALNHPNILTIFEFDEINGIHYLVSEFVEGETLFARLQHSQLSIYEVLEIAIQIASALQSAQKVGIIHRDIKSENIMIRRDGLIKILDFGLAKSLETKSQIIDSDAPTLAHTQAGVILGTAFYMSPEQARGNKLDARTDIWSLGIVMYEMLTGRRAFDGETTSDVIASILKSEPVQPRELRPEIPKRFEKIILKALRKNFEERHQTASLVLSDLQKLKKELEIEDEFKRISGSKIAGDTQFISSETDTIKEAATTQRLHSSNRNKFIFGGLAAILLAVLGIWYFTNNSSGSAPIESIAVLPFINESGNADVEYLSDGITESLIRSLSQIPKLSVKAHSSVLRYKGKENDPQTVGRELSVQAVLNGRVIERGDNLSLNIELVDTQTGNVLWNQQYNRKVNDLTQLQSEIAGETSQKLRQRLSGAEKQMIEKSYTENTEAYQLYLRGRYYWNKRTAEGLKKSVEYFNQAIEADPNYALAYAGLAESYVIFSGYSISPPQDAYPKAKAAAKKALELDETLAEAHAPLGLALLAYDWNAAESEREFQRAIELNPSYATAYHWFGNQNLLYTGRFEEAISKMKRAQELDPLSLVINTDLGDTYLFSRQYDKAIEQFKKTLEMDNNFYYTHYELGMAYQMKGMYAEAIQQYQKARDLNDDPRILGLLGHAYASSGKQKEALEILELLHKRLQEKYVSPYNFVIIYAGLKERDKAFEWLEKAYQDHTSRMAILGVDPFLDNLRSDPRLAEIINRVGLTSK